MSRMAVAALALALALAACGAATPEARPPTVVSTTAIFPATPREVTPPVLTEMPSPDAMSEAYPGFALEFEITGRVTLLCMAMTTGHLEECRVRSASPEGLGFEDAALSLTPSIRARPQSVDGIERDSRIMFSINFTPAPGPPVIPWTEPEPSPDQVARLRPAAREMIVTDLDTEGLTDGVDSDRVDVVRQIQRDARARYLEDMVDAVALGLARVLKPEQVDALVERRPSPGWDQDPKRSAASSDRLVEVYARYRKFVRERYCELYNC